MKILLTLALVAVLSISAHANCQRTETTEDVPKNSRSVRENAAVNQISNSGTRRRLFRTGIFSRNNRGKNSGWADPELAQKPIRQ